MSSAGVDAILYRDSFSPTSVTGDASAQSSFALQQQTASSARVSAAHTGPRRTPRKSLIVVLPENHVVSPDLVSDSVSTEADGEVFDVILACAGPPLSIGTLQRRVRDLQVLLAPAGTSSEDLRELAMSQAPGDIVTLLTGRPVSV